MARPWVGRNAVAHGFFVPWFFSHGIFFDKVECVSWSLKEGEVAA
jgi:hypothetical protein